MTENVTLVIFEIDGQRYALPLHVVVRVVRAVEVTPLPHAPAAIYGAINLQGRVIPVMNLRQCLGYPERSVALNDAFLIVHDSNHWLALWVDAVREVMQATPQAVVPAETIAPGVGDVASIVKLADGLLLVQDPMRLFAAWDAGAVGVTSTEVSNP